MLKFQKDKLWLIKDFLEEMKEGCEYMEDQAMFELTIQVIEELIKE